VIDRKMLNRLPAHVAALAPVTAKFWRPFALAFWSNQSYASDGNLASRYDGSGRAPESPFSEQLCVIFVSSGFRIPCLPRAGQIFCAQPRISFLRQRARSRARARNVARFAPARRFVDLPSRH
jgi:hypothetical protein